MDYGCAVILSDLDGTLFNSGGRISPEDLSAVRDFIGGGGLFGLATGREPHNVRLFLPDLPLNAPSIVLNGAAVYDFARERYLSARFMDKGAALDVLLYCRETGLSLDMQVYTTDGIFYATPLETADPEFLRIHRPCAFMPLERLAEADWFKLVLLERAPGALRTMRAYMKEKGYGSRISLVEGTTDVVKVGLYQELLPPDVNKGTAFPDLRALPACAGRTVFAAGDYWNDLELLRAVDVPCAPANAIPEIRSACRYILPSNNDSPIAGLIRGVIPSL